MKNIPRIFSLNSKKRTSGLCCQFAFLLLLATLFGLPTSAFAFGLKVPRFQQALWPSRQNTTPHPSVARIIVSEKDGVSMGSGTLIEKQEKQGIVVTNWHVVRDATGDISVLFPDGSHSLAQVLKVDRHWDLAALLIWCPQHIEPVSFSPTAPKPGDLLTIAGYGSGSYRAASGRCTQYVSPGKNFPYEIVELSVQARDGDSGGPIFNHHGQLAGVLFGASRGSTSGSYSGRVQAFLSSVQLSATTIAQQQRSPDGPAPETIAQAGASAQADSQSYTSLPQSPSHRPVGATREIASSTREDYISFQRTPLPFSSDTTENQTPSIHWQDLLGVSRLEQAKTLLAAIGLLAVLIQVTKFLG